MTALAVQAMDPITYRVLFGSLAQTNLALTATVTGGVASKGRLPWLTEADNRHPPGRKASLASANTGTAHFRTESHKVAVLAQKDRSIL